MHDTELDYMRRRSQRSLSTMREMMKITRKYDEFRQSDDGYPPEMSAKIQLLKKVRDINKSSFKMRIRSGGDLFIGYSSKESV